MEHAKFADAVEERPGAGWRRVGLVGSEPLSIDWFEKPSGHVSERHHHAHVQAFVVLSGRLTLHTDTDAVELGPLDAAWTVPDEPHWSENPGEEPTTGLNVFAPGRAFPYWTSPGHD